MPTDAACECAYCGSDAIAHRNVRVIEGDGEPLGRFCGYACLVQYVEREELTLGEACDCAR
jgi:hypothetical protein